LQWKSNTGTQQNDQNPNQAQPSNTAKPANSGLKFKTGK